MFQTLALELLALGLCPVLLKPGLKEPVFHSFNRWQIGQLSPNDLQLSEDKRPLYYNPKVIESWAREYPTANIGILTREAPTVDIDNPAAWEVVQHILPATPYIKAGARGWSMIYRPSVSDPISRTRRFANGDLVHIEVLADGRQTVLPPSIHPDTGRPYVWLENSGPLGTYGPAPELTQTHVQEIELALRTAGLLTTRVIGTKTADDGPWVGNEDRYAKFFRTRLTDKFAILSQAVSGSRQQALNDAVLSCSSAVRVGALSQQELYEAMHQACLQNGYIQTDGEKAFHRQFWKALEEGYEISELPDLGPRQVPSASAGEVFAGRPAPMVGSVPTSHDANGVPLEPLQVYEVGALASTQAPARQWSLQDWIPHKQVSLVYGDGGIGKTTLLMQLGISLAAGRPFMGLPVTKRRVLLISAEDEIAEVHYRIHEMGKALQMPTDGFKVVSLADRQDVHIWTPQHGVTPLLGQIEELVRAERIDAVMFDPIADLFGGLDIDKQQVNRFMRTLRKRLCFDLGCTVVIAAHPSSTGLQTGRGTSGTVAWSNSARSRLYFERVGDSDTLELSMKKSNRSALGKPLRMRWVKGVFIRCDETAVGDIPADQIKAVFDELEKRQAGYYVTSKTADAWVGKMIGRELNIDRSSKEGKVKIDDILARWEKAGFIKFDVNFDKSRNRKVFIEYVKHPTT